MRLNPRTGLTCINCNLVFSNGEEQRNHYAGEWHLYNVKRQIAGLPSINEDDFNKKLKLYSEAKSTEKSEEKFCSKCRKNFHSIKAYQNHLNSNRHKEIADEVRIDVPNSDNNDGKTVKMNGMQQKNVLDNNEKSEEITLGDCLFCESSSRDFETALVHMTQHHGFLIPDFKFCSDVQGLLTYLGLKIGEGKTCIRCNNRFRDKNSVRKHMFDKNHCNFRIDDGEEALLEYLDFYDYGHYEDDDDGNAPDDVPLYDDGFFLTLPSGATIGHRSLMRYFKQSLKPISFVKNSTRLTGSKMKELGWTGLSGAISVKHAKDVSFMKRAVQNYRLKQGMINNKIFVSKGRSDQM